jgi:hypothetical protein
MPLPPARSQAFVPPPARPLARGSGMASPPSEILCISCAPLRMGTPGPLATVEHNDKPITDTKEMTVMHQLTQLEA